MSEYKVYKCDRCGKESTKVSEIEKIYLRVVQRNNFASNDECIKQFFYDDADKYYDLCEECSKEFVHFLQMDGQSKVREVSKKNNDYWDVRLENNNSLQLPKEMSDEDFLALTKGHGLTYDEDFNLYSCDECKNVVTENKVRINTFPIKVGQGVKHIYVCTHCGRSFVHIKAQMKE